jgi:hypothetical protein
MSLRSTLPRGTSFPRGARVHVVRPYGPVLNDDWRLSGVRLRKLRILCNALRQRCQAVPPGQIYQPLPRWLINVGYTYDFNKRSSEHKGSSQITTLVRELLIQPQITAKLDTLLDKMARNRWAALVTDLFRSTTTITTTKVAQK